MFFDMIDWWQTEVPNKIKGFLNKGTTVEVNETNVVKIVSLERPLRSVEQVGFGRKSDGLLHITEHRERERERLIFANKPNTCRYSARKLGGFTG